jgi:adenylate cyclase class 2
MPIEIEAKMKVNDHAAVRERLLAAGAARIGSAHQISTLFDTADRALFKSDKGLRLREERGESGQTNLCVTYKGPRAAGPIKSREEIEFSVADADAATRLFESLGFAPVLVFEKRRETWTLADCEIALDELPRIGSFVEIEGPSEAGILYARETLGLSDRPMIRDSYVALLLDHLDRRGERATEVRF